MDFTVRTTVVLLLAFAATHGFAVLSTATAGSKYACYHGATYSKRCAGFHPHADVFTDSPSQGRALLWARKQLYGGSESAIKQLSPTLRARAFRALRLDDRERGICDEAGRRAPCAPERNLADALIQPPNAATAKILRETGLPIIPGVPPIVIIRPDDLPGGTQ